MGVFKRLPNPFGQEKLVEPISVVRVQPRTSKGITDLLLPQTSITLTVTRVPLRSLNLIEKRYFQVTI